MSIKIIRLKKGVTVSRVTQWAGFVAGWAAYTALLFRTDDLTVEALATVALLATAIASYLNSGRGAYILGYAQGLVDADKEDTP